MILVVIESAAKVGVPVVMIKLSQAISERNVLFIAVEQRAMNVEGWMASAQHSSLKG
jgi:hypothetical protein